MGTTSLTRVEQSVVALFEGEVSFVEIKAQTGLGTERDEQMRTFVGRVIALARLKPDAEYEAAGKNRAMREVLADAAARLKPYEAELSEELELAAAALPPAK